jgi:hypothetical protein
LPEVAPLTTADTPGALEQREHVRPGPQGALLYGGRGLMLHEIGLIAQSVARRTLLHHLRKDIVKPLQPPAQSLSWVTFDHDQWSVPWCIGTLILSGPLLPRSLWERVRVMGFFQALETPVPLANVHNNR